MKKIIFLLLTILSGVICSPQEKTSLPEDSMSFWLPYKPGSNTIALFQFEPPGQLSDARGLAPDLVLPAGVTVEPEGHFGHCLCLKPEHGNLLIVPGENIFQRQRFIIDFWFQTDSLPQKEGFVYLLFKEHVYRKTNGFFLKLNSDGSLLWQSRTLASSEKDHPEWVVEIASEPQAVKPKRWHHVAIYTGDYSPAFGSDVACLYLDGKLINQQPHGWRYINYGIKEERATPFLLASSPDSKNSFSGKIDQFRIVSGLYRKFYPAPEESWVDTEKKRTWLSDSRFFAAESDILFYVSFDGSLKADIARGNPSPVRLLSKPEFAPGVRGQAWRSQSGWMPLAYSQKDNLHPGMGAVEFWMKPLGWQKEGTLLQWFFRSEKGPNLFIPNDGFSVQVSGGMENQNVEYFPDSWMHFVLVWADRQIRLFVNGEEKLTGLMNQPFSAAEEKCLMSPGFGKPMLIDELTIYRRPLSAWEVKNHYLRYFPGKNFTPCSDIDCLYTFFQGVGKILGTVYLRKNLPEQAETVSVCLKKENRILSQTDVSFLPEQAAVFLLKNIPVGLPSENYHLAFDFLDRQAKKISSQQIPFTFKHYPWLGNTIGIPDRVLKPWTPIKVKSNLVEVVGRTYQLDKSGLFAQITSQNQPLLAAPMNLKVKLDGKTMFLSGDKLKIISQEEIKVHWQAEASAKNTDIPLKVEIDGLMEFDGHTVFTLNMVLLKKPALLEGFSLELPLQGDFVRFYLNCFGIGHPYGTGGYPPYGQLKETEGCLFSSKTWYEYLGWDGLMQTTGIFDFQRAADIAEKKLKLEKRWKPTAGNFIPQMWVGDDLVGLAYMADSDRGWIPDDEQPAITLSRYGKTVIWSFNFISTPVQLTDNRQIVLSFQATPEKPQPPDWRKHFWRGPHPPPAGSITCQWLSDSAGWDEEGVGPYPYQPEKARAITESLRSQGIKVTPHLDTSSLNWGAKTAGELAAEWDSGGIQYNQIFTPSKIDFFIWSLKKWKDAYGIDGVYFDTGTPRPNYNIFSGTAYLLPDGRVQPGWTMFGQRQCYQRAAFVFGDIGTEGFNWSCGYTGPQIAGWQFAAVPGGEYRIDYAMDYYPGPFDLMRIYSNSGKFGTLMMWMGYSDYLQKNQAPEKFEKFFRHMYAMMLPLDAKWCFGAFNYPDAFYRLCYADADVSFFGFWKNPYLSVVNPDENIKVSMYLKSNGRALVIISNLSDKLTPICLKLAARKMGIDPGKTSVLDAEEKEYSRPQVLTSQWYYWLNRGGCPLFPEKDKKLQEITTRSEQENLIINLVVPAHDYRLLEILPEKKIN